MLGLFGSFLYDSNLLIDYGIHHLTAVQEIQGSNSNQLNVGNRQVITGLDNTSGNSNSNIENNNNGNIIVITHTTMRSYMVPSIGLESVRKMKKKGERGRPSKFPLNRDDIRNDISSIDKDKNSSETSGTITVNKVQKIKYKRRIKTKSTQII